MMVNELHIVIEMMVQYLHRLFGGDGAIKTVNELHIVILTGYWELMVQYWVTVYDGAKCCRTPFT